MNRLGLLVPTSCAEKVKLEGDQDADGVVPFPPKEAEGAAPVKSPDGVIVPLRFPCAVGVKVTVMVQLVPAGTALPQLLVWAKSPVIWMPLRLTGALPVLVKVSVCAALVPTTWFPKLRAVGESVAALMAPVPVRLALLFTVPETVSDAVCVLLECGAKVTLMVQLVLVAKVAGQLLVWLKSAGTDTLDMLRPKSPVLVYVNVWLPEVVLTSTLPKSNDAGVSDACAA